MSNTISAEKRPLTQGAHHVGLTVTDLEGARAFFVDALRFELVAELPDYPAVFLTDGVTMLTLWRVTDPDDANAFDRHRNVGLHHLALSVDPSALDEVAAAAAAHPGVIVEFPSEALGDTGLRHMMCNIPGGPRLELVGAA